MDALVRVAERRGYVVENSKQSPYPTQMVIDDERMKFKLFERYCQLNRKPAFKTARSSAPDRSRRQAVEASQW